MKLVSSKQYVAAVLEDRKNQKHPPSGRDPGLGRPPGCCGRGPQAGASGAGGVIASRHPAARPQAARVFSP